MSETIDNFLAEPRVLADTPAMQNVQETLGAVRLIRERLPVLELPFFVEAILQREVDSHQKEYDEAQDRIAEELSTGATKDRVRDELSIPRDNSQISGAVIIELPKKVEQPERLAPTFRVDAPRAFGHS